MSACERSEQVLAKRELSLAPQGAYIGEDGGSEKMEHAETHDSAFLT